jgi:hypothetical protein
MNPTHLLLAGVAAFLIFGRKSTGKVSILPGSSKTPANGYPTNQPGAPVLAPPGSTGNQIGVALAQNSGAILSGIGNAFSSIYDWARAPDPAPAAASTFDYDEDVPILDYT